MAPLVKFAPQESLAHRNDLDAPALRTKYRRQVATRGKSAPVAPTICARLTNHRHDRAFESLGPVLEQLSAEAGAKTISFVRGSSLA